MTMDDYLSPRMITTPFGLYDCDVPVRRRDRGHRLGRGRATDLAKPPVLFEAVGTQIIERTDWDQSTLTHEPQALGQAAHLWTRTSLRPKDVDVAELYDGFSFNCLSWIEALGFCGIGEAKDFLDGGKNIARDGVLPINTHGGQLSHGRTHGMGLIHEAVTQLRGEAGDRQVARRQSRRDEQRRSDPERAMLLTVSDDAREARLDEPRESRSATPTRRHRRRRPDVGARAQRPSSRARSSSPCTAAPPRRRTSTARAIRACHCCDLLRTLGFTVIALDRPGFGTSALYSSE